MADEPKTSGSKFEYSGRRLFCTERCAQIVGLFRVRPPKTNAYVAAKAGIHIDTLREWLAKGRANWADVDAARGRGAFRQLDAYGEFARDVAAAKAEAV